MKFFQKVTLVSISVILLFSLIHLVSFTENKEALDKNGQQDMGDNYKVYSLSIPKDLNFANERVPLDIIDVRDKLDRELLVNTYWQSNSILMHKRASRWFPVIEEILQKNKVPEDFKYLALIESGLTNAVSPAGATGFWQFMKKTGVSYSLEISTDVDERYHLEKSTQAACEYLKESYEKFGSWTLAAASYNMGMSGLNKTLENQKVTSYYDLLLNQETGRYVYRILAVKEILLNSKKYGFNIVEDDLYQPYKTFTVSVDSTIGDLARFSSNNGFNYKTLKLLNPWLRSNKLPVEKNKMYEVKVPSPDFNLISK